MAGPSALDWLDYYDRSFQRDVAPLLQRQMERRAEAAQMRQEKRQLDYQLMRDQAARAFTAQRDEAEMQNRMLLAERETRLREEAETQRAKLANQSMMERLRTEHNLKSEDEKERERREMVDKANEYGASLPASTDYETASKAFVDSFGKSYIQLNKRAGEAVRAIMQHTGSDSTALTNRIANAIADDPSLEKLLTPAEREKIRNSTDLKAIRKDLIKDPKKYNAFTRASKDATDFVMAQMEKEYASKPEVAVATASLRQVNDALAAANKKAGVPPSTLEAAMDAYNQAIRGPTPAGPAAPPVRPPPSSIMNMGPAAGSQPAVPMAPGATQQFFTPTPAEDAAYISTNPTASSALGTGGGWRNIMPNLIGNPAPVQTSPIRGPQMNPQLQQFLQDQAASQQLLAPTAFPPLRVPQSAP